MIIKIAYDTIFVEVVCMEEFILKKLFFRCLSHQIQELHLQLDQLELLLGGAKVLEYHLCPKTIGYLLEIKDNPVIVKDIIHKLLKNTSMRSTSATFQEWNTLLKDMIKLSKTIFTCFDEMLCHQVVLFFHLLSIVFSNLL